ncbi:MAG: ornithine cyclodeaminase family protein [Chloroflexi bacterium]|nr:ornithine cyclodeaminase family protein [Chloroflexota bacterium]
MPRILSRDEVTRLLSMADAIRVVEQALIEFSAGEAVMPVRGTTAVPPHRGLLLTMPAYLSRSDALATKMVTVYPQNPARGLPVILAVIVVFDPQSGAPLAIMDGVHVTAVRTAAASAVATKYLAREDARVLGIIGTGVQGASHLWAMREVRPVERAVVFNRTRAKAEEFAQAMQAQHGVPVAVAHSAEEVARAADVLVLATSATEPVIRAAWLKPGCHINAIGTHTPTMRELDSDTVARARVVVDSRDANRVECGDLLIPMQEGRISLEHFADEVGEVASGRKPGRRSLDELTIFKSVGIAVEDAATGALVYQRALEQSVGTEVEL